MPSWYALHVASNTEKSVTDRLDQAGIDSFYPHVKVRSKDGRREVERKFFPGYVFARFLWADRTPVMQNPQVIRILGLGSAPCPIPDPEAEAIRVMANSALASLAVCPYVTAGQTVAIQRGPLRGLEGFVSHVKPGKARVAVSVRMLQRSLSVEVDVTDIAVIPTPRPAPCMTLSPVPPPASPPQTTVLP